MDTDIRNVNKSTLTSLSCTPCAFILNPIKNVAVKVFALIDEQYDRYFSKTGFPISVSLIGLCGAALTLNLSYWVAVPLLISGCVFGILSIRNNTYTLVTEKRAEINEKRAEINEKEAEYKSIQNRSEKIYRELEAQLAVIKIKNNPTLEEYKKNVALASDHLIRAKAKLLAIKCPRSISFSSVHALNHLLDCGTIASCVDFVKWLEVFRTTMHELKVNASIMASYQELIQLAEPAHSQKELLEVAKTIATRLKTLREQLFLADNRPYDLNIEKNNNAFHDLGNLITKFSSFSDSFSLHASESRVRRKILKLTMTWQNTLDTNKAAMDAILAYSSKNIH